MLSKGKCVRRCSEKRAIVELTDLAATYHKLTARIDCAPSLEFVRILAKNKVSLYDARRKPNAVLECGEGVTFSLGPGAALSGFPEKLKTNYLHFDCALEALAHCEADYLNLSELEGFPARHTQFAVKLATAPPQSAMAWKLNEGLWCEIRPVISFGRNFFLVDQSRIVADGDYVPNPGTLRLLFPGVPVLMTGERFYQMLQLSICDRNGLITHSLYEVQKKKFLALVTFHIDVFPSFQKVIPENSKFSSAIFGV